MRSAIAYLPEVTDWPRGIAMRPRAEADPAAILRNLNASLDSFKATQERRLDTLEAAIDQRLLADASSALGGASMGKGTGYAPDPEYSAAFASFVRNGGREDDLRRFNAEGYRAQVQAAMSVGSTSDGGYLAPMEWDGKVRRAEILISPMRRIATVVTTGTTGFMTLWSNNLWGSGWLGETAARPNTSTPTLSPLVFSAGEIYANIAVTQRLLDDAQFPLEAWLATNIADEFSRQESIAFISGDGGNKPNGFLTYVTGGLSAGQHPGGNISTIATAAAGTITFDDLKNLAFGLPSPYRTGATWLFNSATASVLSKIKDASQMPIWQTSMAEGQPATLLGYPVEIDEGMPSIATGALAVAFGNFAKGYLINDRTGISLLRDPYTNKPYVNFYSTKRVGAGLLDPKAILIIKVT